MRQESERVSANPRAGERQPGSGTRAAIYYGVGTRSAVMPMTNRFALLFVLLLVVSGTTRAQVTARSQGAFIDKDNTTHHWAVNAAHTLIWDDKPFVPVGGCFRAHSWAANATDSDYDSDVAALQTLKAHGIADIYVQPAKSGLTAVPPARIQKLLDYLDANDFTYGVSLNDGPREPLTGYVVRPGAFRQVVPKGGTDVRFLLPDTSSALYYTVTANAADVRDEGEVVPNGDEVRITARADAGFGVDPGDVSAQTIVLLIPERIYTAGNRDLAMPNLWEGFDNYRDSVIALFEAVHFGKGFRFLCDPLPQNLALSPAFAHFLPTSLAFRAEWAAWLGKKYRNSQSVGRAWGTMDRPLVDLDEASTLVPLWSGGKGIAGYYDAKIKKRLRTNTAASAFWDDLAAFKAESVRGYMNDLAIALKRTVADVPVVYRNTPGVGWNDLFAFLPPTRGFDGLGIVAYGHGSDLATRSAAYTLAQAAESPKAVWMPVLATGDDTGDYGTENTLASSLASLQNAGAKGFYLSDIRRLAEAKGTDSLDWLNRYAQVLDTNGMRTRADSAGVRGLPNTVFYPRKQLPDLSPTLLPNGNGWWLPTSRPGQVYDFGVVGRAYSIEEPGTGTVYTLWNAHGTQRIEIAVPKSALNDKSGTRVGWSANADGNLNQHKQALSLTLGAEPIQLLNYPAIPVPSDAFALAQGEANAFIKTMKDAKRLDYARFQGDLMAVHHDKENAYSGLAEMLAELAQIRLANRHYLWIDAELCPSHSFDEIAVLPGASGNQVLRVDARESDAPATAHYQINLGDTKPQSVWVAMSPDALVSLRLDGRPLVDEATIPQKVGKPYADGALSWMRFGTATIPKGTHTLEVRADSAALIDVILFTPQPFTPQGANPPPVTP